MKIAVAGTGYVGLSIATLLAQHNQVVAVDVLPEKVEKINQRISPIQDDYIEQYLAQKELNLRATLDGREAYKDADFVVIPSIMLRPYSEDFLDGKNLDYVKKKTGKEFFVVKNIYSCGELIEYIKKASI